LILFSDVGCWNFHYIYIRLPSFISENVSTLARISGEIQRQHWKHKFFFIYLSSQPKNESVQKSFFYIGFCRAFSADHSDKKAFQISLKNHGVIVKRFIMKTAIVRVFLYNIQSRFIQCSQFQICESAFPYIISYVTAFSILTITSPFLNEIRKVFLPK
jgi:hypothetical protein